MYDHDSLRRVASGSFTSFANSGVMRRLPSRGGAERSMNSVRTGSFALASRRASRNVRINLLIITTSLTYLHEPVLHECGHHRSRIALVRAQHCKGIRQIHRHIDCIDAPSSPELERTLSFTHTCFVSL